MFEQSQLSSMTVVLDKQRGRYMLTLSRESESVTLNVRYRTQEEAKRAGNAMLSEWSRTGRKPRG